MPCFIFWRSHTSWSCVVFCFWAPRLLNEHVGVEYLHQRGIDRSWLLSITFPNHISPAAIDIVLTCVPFPWHDGAAIHLYGSNCCLRHWQSRPFEHAKNWLHGSSVRQPVTFPLCAVFSHFPKGRLRMETQTMQLTVQLKESIYLLLIDVPFERYSVWYWVLLPYDKWCGGDVGGWRWQTRRVKSTNRDSIDAPDLKLSAWRRLFLCVFVYFPVYERVGLLEYVCASFYRDKDNMENTYFQWVHL